MDFAADIERQPVVAQGATGCQRDHALVGVDRRDLVPDERSAVMFNEARGIDLIICC